MNLSGNYYPFSNAEAVVKYYDKCQAGTASLFEKMLCPQAIEMKKRLDSEALTVEDRGYIQNVQATTAQVEAEANKEATMQKIKTAALVLGIIGLVGYAVYQLKNN